MVLFFGLILASCYFSNAFKSNFVKEQEKKTEEKSPSWGTFDTGSEWMWLQDWLNDGGKVKGGRKEP